MRIVLFTGSLGRGGAERVLSLLANHFVLRGWQVEICMLLKHEVGYQIDNRVKIVDLTNSSGSYVQQVPTWIKAIRKYLRNAKPDIIISFFGRISILLSIARIGMNYPLIASERNDPMHDGRSKLTRWLCNICYLLCEAVVYQTNYEASCFSKRVKKHIIPNPVEVACPTGSNCENVIVAVGRLLPQKNYKMLLSVFKQLVLDSVDINLNIYGDGVLRDSLMEETIKENLQDRVTFCGNVADLHNRIKDAKFFVMTSEYEGLSNATIEAMKLGIPCISTAYPGAEELILHNVNGVLVPCGDVRQCVKEIEDLMINSDRYNAIRKNALKLSEKYNPSIVFEQWDNVVEDVLRGKIK